ncbi:MAG: hypothetical protein GC168_21455 [Candidatus Hydrogenedens sp.]|nr:hypothetical protein [Candidatus Hydrogenedens sp.]
MRAMHTANSTTPRAWWAAALAAAVLLSLISGFNQVKAMGLSWQEEHYTARLEAVAAGEAGSPWQYRVLSDGLTLAAIHAAEAAGVQRAAGVTMVAIRIAQNIALFLLLFGYLSAAGVSAYAALLGMMALAWIMTLTNYNSDLAVNTYTEIVLYLAAGWCVLLRWSWPILPMTVIAALNRETSGLIPLMLLASAYGWTDPRERVAGLRIGAAALAAYGVVFCGLRLWFGSRGWEVHPSGAVQGWALLRYNLTFDRSWGHLAGTFSLLPLLAVFGWRGAPSALKAFTLVVLPVWIPVHLLFSAVAETRLFLVPLVVVVLPLAMLAVQRMPEAETA